MLKEGKMEWFWKLLRWVIVNKKTHEMANLNSWRLGGVRIHWPIDEYSLVWFGLILQSHQLLAKKVVQCCRSKSPGLTSL